MTANIILFLGWLWDDMTKSPSHIALTCALAIVVVCFLWCTNADGLTTTAGVIGNGLLLTAASVLEVFGHLAHHGDRTWMLGSIGNFVFSLCLLFVVFLMMMVQYRLTSAVLGELAGIGQFRHRYNTGFSSIIVAAVALIVASFIGDVATAVVGLVFLGYQVYVMGYSIVTAIRDGDVGYAALSVVVYLASVVGLVCLFAHFILPAIFAAILMVMTTGDSSQHCATCRSYSNGYCYYRQRQVTSRDEACNKYQA